MNKLYEIFIIAGDKGASVHTPDLWGSTPLGFGITLVILIVSIINIFHKGINDGLFIRVYYWVLLILSLISILHIVENSMPKHQLHIMICAFAIKMAYGTTVRLRRYKLTGKIQENND